RLKTATFAAGKGLNRQGLLGAWRLRGTSKRLERKLVMKPMKWLSGILVLAMVVAASGCGGGGSSLTPASSQQPAGSVFVTGTDAPLPSVLSFQVDITGMTVSDGTNPPVSVRNGAQTV